MAGYNRGFVPYQSNSPVRRVQVTIGRGRGKPKADPFWAHRMADGSVMGGTRGYYGNRRGGNRRGGKPRYRRRGVRYAGRARSAIPPSLARAMYTAASQIKMTKKLAFWEKMNKLDIHTKAEAALYQLRHRQAIQLVSATRKVIAAQQRIGGVKGNEPVDEHVHAAFHQVKQTMDAQLDAGLPRHFTHFMDQGGVTGFRLAPSKMITDRNTRHLEHEEVAEHKKATHGRVE